MTEIDKTGSEAIRKHSAISPRKRFSDAGSNYTSVVPRRSATGRSSLSLSLSLSLSPSLSLGVVLIDTRGPARIRVCINVLIMTERGGREDAVLESRREFSGENSPRRVAAIVVFR